MSVLTHGLLGRQLDLLLGKFLIRHKSLADRDHFIIKEIKLDIGIPILVVDRKEIQLRYFLDKDIFTEVQ